MSTLIPRGQHLSTDRIFFHIFFFYFLDTHKKNELRLKKKRTCGNGAPRRVSFVVNTATGRHLSNQEPRPNIGGIVEIITKQQQQNSNETRRPVSTATSTRSFFFGNRVAKLKEKEREALFCFGFYKEKKRETLIKNNVRRAGCREKQTGNVVKAGRSRAVKREENGVFLIEFYWVLP